MSDGTLSPQERLTLGALRYAVNDEAGRYLAIMRLFTDGISGFQGHRRRLRLPLRLLQPGVAICPTTNLHILTLSDDKPITK